jgi:hypothetical protein
MSEGSVSGPVPSAPSAPIVPPPHYLSLSQGAAVLVFLLWLVLLFLVAWLFSFNQWAGGVLLLFPLLAMTFCVYVSISIAFDRTRRCEFDPLYCADLERMNQGLPSGPPPRPL